MSMDILDNISKIVKDNLTNQQFGVSELARELGMSRSSLLRKVKKLTKLSVNQLTRQIRLQHAMQMLNETEFTVSEIAFRVGFSSVSYFIKCFREYYGYPPGEVGRESGSSTGQLPSDQYERSHQLVAIMFTDIQGYTALMQKDEVKAIELRNRHREVFNKFTRQYSGRILQYYGDGTLSTFSSAIDAVRCGIQMQLAFRNEPAIPVRIGIHSGDIVLAEEDIIGDGVNVASRIESLAVAGSVFVSAKIYDEVKNQPDILTVSMGKFELKNVDQPMEVFAIANHGLAIPSRDQIRGKAQVAPIREPVKMSRNGIKSYGLWALVFLLAVFVALAFYKWGSTASVEENVLPGHNNDRKSIAVLPFRNDSNDSSNVYIINGLMEAILNNLQKIEDMRVISRTSVEKYRNLSKTLPEISRELKVNYVVEGSGQKIGDKILLNVQLVDASTDQHLWAEQYARDAHDIFQLQTEVAKSIASQIEVIITPEEQERIEQIPTDNLEAYDYFLKGLDHFTLSSVEGLLKAIDNFEQAINLDPEFARAYADIAISYYYLDLFRTDKQHLEKVNNYADKALLYDPQLPQGLVAKSLFYIADGEYSLALPHLEKALEHNPNSAMVLNILSDFYTVYVPNTSKYLEYAIKAIQIDLAANDSATASTTYLHLSNAFIQAGFVDQAEKYINLSLDYDPENIFAEYVKAYILYTRDSNLEQTKKLLIRTLQKDSTRLDVIQEIAKVCFYLRDFQESYKYYSWYGAIKDSLNLDIYPGEDAKIAVVLSKIGMSDQSKVYFNRFLEYAERDRSIYHHLSLAAYFSYHGNRQEALRHLRFFSREEGYHYWILLFLEIDPLMDPIANSPQFREIMNDIKTKFWEEHERIRANLVEKNLI